MIVGLSCGKSTSSIWQSERTGPVELHMLQPKTHMEGVSVCVCVPVSQSSDIHREQNKDNQQSRVINAGFLESSHVQGPRLRRYEDISSASI